MIRVCAVLLSCFAWVCPVTAQTPNAPIMEIEFEETEAIPGQPLTLRMTILVPTWLTKPVVFPSFETPNLLVRLPERATTPVSRREGQVTLAGVSRRYQLSPMVPQAYSIPPQEVIVVWSDPDGGGDRQDTLTTPALTFTGVLPEGAEGLDPFIAAQSIELTQTITGAEAPLVPGDSVTREVVAAIKGTSPMFLPPLLPVQQVQGIAQYPAEPIVTETEQRGEISGSRMESVTFIAQTGGDGAAVPIVLRWYNLDSGQVEEARVEGIDLGVDAPIAPQREPLDLRALAWLIAPFVLVVLLVFLTWPRLHRAWRRYRRARHETYLASDDFAFDQAQAAVRRKDVAGLLSAVELWLARRPAPTANSDAALRSAIAGIGAARYGQDGGNEQDAWRAVQNALTAARREQTRDFDQGRQLPPLNP